MRVAVEASMLDVLRAVEILVRKREVRRLEAAMELASLCQQLEARMAAY